MLPRPSIQRKDAPRHRICRRGQFLSLCRAHTRKRHPPVLRCDVWAATGALRTPLLWQAKTAILTLRELALNAPVLCGAKLGAIKDAIWRAAKSPHIDVRHDAEAAAGAFLALIMSRDEEEQKWWLNEVLDRIERGFQGRPDVAEAPEHRRPTCAHRMPRRPQPNPWC